MFKCMVAVLAMVFVPVGFASIAWAKGNITTGNSYYFTGTEFREGKSPEVATIFFRDGYLPFVQSGEETPRGARLPEGTGGLAVLCFVQIAGGKMKGSSGYSPIGGAPVEINGGGGRLAVRADGEGYAVLALPPGEYEVRLAGMVRKVRIEKGKNVLVAIRGGKRMVD